AKPKVTRKPLADLEKDLKDCQDEIARLKPKMDDFVKGGPRPPTTEMDTYKALRQKEKDLNADIKAVHAEDDQLRAALKAMEDEIKAEEDAERAALIGLDADLTFGPADPAADKAAKAIAADEAAKDKAAKKQLKQGKKADTKPP